MRNRLPEAIPRFCSGGSPTLRKPLTENRLHRSGIGCPRRSAACWPPLLCLPQLQLNKEKNESELLPQSKWTGRPLATGPPASRRRVPR